MIVLGIETSCDETGVALYDQKQKSLLSNKLYSQIALHNEYGGVVPELASRDHVAKLPILTREALKESSLSVKDIDAVAYTARPGLVGALMVGASYAKGLAYGLNIPSIAIHHLEGHLIAPQLDDQSSINYPYLALLVSGGHTQIIEVFSFGQYHLIGESIDDAAGEAFDKTAKLLGLPYPGGPYLAELALKGNKDVYALPRPMTDRPGLDFSFSGLKTAALQAWEKTAEKTIQAKADLCYEFQQAIIDTLMIKIKRALKQTKIKQLVVAGGVSANKSLRDNLEKFAIKLDVSVVYPPIQYCTDNGAMIAIAGAQRLERGFQDVNSEINVKPRSPLNECGSN